MDEREALLERFRLKRCPECGYDLMMAQTTETCPGCEGPGSDTLLVQGPIRPVQAGTWILILVGCLFIISLPFAVHGIIFVLRGLPRHGINRASGAALISGDSIRFLRDHTSKWIQLPWSACRECRVRRALVQGDSKPPLSAIDRWQLVLRFHDRKRDELVIEFKATGTDALALRTHVRSLMDNAL